MKLRPLAILALATFSLVAAEPNQLSDQEKAEGWQLLFNGADLSGWKRYNSSDEPGAGWQVSEGILKKVANQTGGNIVAEGNFGDFEFTWEWRISENGNSGVKYLVSEKRPATPGPEYQLLDDERHAEGKAGSKRQSASLYDILPSAADKLLKPAGEWNHSRILVRGKHVEHWLNDRKVLEYELGSVALKKAIAASKFKDVSGFGEKISGQVMLTDHEDPCDFRNLKIRRLQPD